jgi:hypothetical protein
VSAWDLPTAAEIGGTTYDIRSDYRAALDILTLMADPELTDGERGALALEVLYPGIADMPPEHYGEAASFLQWFVAGGDAGASPPRRKLADWNQDFRIIAPPVSRVLGFEVRSVEYLHWWTFLGAYMEVGDCLFAQVVAIRKKKSQGKKLEKHEREFYRDNRELVDFHVTRTDAEKEILDEWIGGATNG